MNFILQNLQDKNLEEVSSKLLESIATLRAQLPLRAAILRAKTYLSMVVEKNQVWLAVTPGAEGGRHPSL